MKYKFPMRLFVLITACCMLTARAEVLDRIVAVVDSHIITLSDLRQEREIRTALGEKTIDTDTELARGLIDVYLIGQQISDFPNIDVTDAEVQTEIDKLTPRPASSERLLDAVRRRIRIQKFFDVKFRQLIRPSDAEVRRYYEEVFLPAAKEKGLQPILPVTDPSMANGIRENIIQETLDHEVSLWLEAIRKKSNVEIFD